MKKRLLLFVSFFAVGLGLLLANAIDIFALEAAIVKISAETKGETKRILVTPPLLAIKRNTMVVWMNGIPGKEIQIVFEEGKTCRDVTANPNMRKPGFFLNSKGCYVTSFLPYMNTSTLQFPEVGSFDYKVLIVDDTMSGKGIIDVLAADINQSALAASAQSDESSWHDLENGYKVRVLSLDKLTSLTLSKNISPFIKSDPDAGTPDGIFLIVEIEAEKSEYGIAPFKSGKNITSVIDDKGHEFCWKGSLDDQGYNPYGELIEISFPKKSRIKLPFDVPKESKGFKLKISKSAPLIDLPGGIKKSNN